MGSLSHCINWNCDSLWHRLCWTRQVLELLHKPGYRCCDCCLLVEILPPPHPPVKRAKLHQHVGHWCYLMFHNDKVIILIQNKINMDPVLDGFLSPAPAGFLTITAFSEFQTSWASSLTESSSGCITSYNSRRGGAWWQNDHVGSGAVPHPGDGCRCPVWNQKPFVMILCWWRFSVRCWVVGSWTLTSPHEGSSRLLSSVSLQSLCDDFIVTSWSNMRYKTLWLR